MIESDKRKRKCVFCKLCKRDYSYIGIQLTCGSTFNTISLNFIKLKKKPRKIMNPMYWVIMHSLHNESGNQPTLKHILPFHLAFAVLRGEMEKDAWYKRLFEAAGGMFFPLVVGSGLPPALRCSALLLTPPQFAMVCLSVHSSVILWSDCVHNAKMILHFWSLHPHLEDDWLEACSGLDDVSHDNDIVDITDDLDGVDIVGCPVTLSNSLNSPSDHMFYAVDVCNHFSSLSIENSQVI